MNKTPVQIPHTEAGNTEESPFNQFKRGKRTPSKKAKPKEKKAREGPIKRVTDSRSTATRRKLHIYW